MNVEIDGPQLGMGHVCKDVLADIPEWFGIEEANRAYAEQTDILPTFVAGLEGEAIGFMALKLHSEKSAELYVLGVLKRFHRQGIGQKLLAASEAYLKQQGVKYIQVKTLAESAGDPNYEKTRKFYTANGYVTLEVFPELWDPHNPALQMIKVI